MPTVNPLRSADDYVAVDYVSGDERIHYGSDSEQFGDIYLPAGAGPFAVVLLIHGGCWQAQYGLAPLGRMARALANQGVAVWNVEYRRLGNGGGWPETFLDVAAAADALRTLERLMPLDLTRVVVAGHSAGGHLALWLAARPQLPLRSELASPNPLRVHTAVSIAGIPDLAGALASNICQGAPRQLLGALPHEAPQRYAEASPVAMTPLGIPHLHINGRRDPIVPPSYVNRYVALARDTGDDVRVLELEGAGHFELVMPDAEPCARVQEAILAMID